MKNLRDLLSKFGFATFVIIIGLILLVMAASDGQNTSVILGIITIIVSAALVALSNAGYIKTKIVMPVVLVVVVGAVSFAWMDYNSIQENLEFMAEQKQREAVVVKRLMDIREAQISYKGVHGKYAASFDQLENHFHNDSMTVIKADGFVPDTLTEAKAVELGIVTRDTLKIGIRDTLFTPNYPIDSLKFVPFSGGQQFELQAGEIEKNKLTVQVFEAFASNAKILNAMDLSEMYIDEDDGLRVGSMTDPHTRGNWE